MNLDDDTALEILMGRDPETIFRDSQQAYIKFHNRESAIRTPAGEIPTSRMHYIPFSRFSSFYNRYKNGDGKINWTPEAVREFDELFLHEETSLTGGIVIFEIDKKNETIRRYSSRILRISK